MPVYLKLWEMIVEIFVVLNGRNCDSSSLEKTYMIISTCTCDVQKVYSMQSRMKLVKMIIVQAS